MTDLINNNQYSDNAQLFIEQMKSYSDDMDEWYGAEVYISYGDDYGETYLVDFDLEKETAKITQNSSQRFNKEYKYLDEVSILEIYGNKSDVEHDTGAHHLDCDYYEPDGDMMYHDMMDR